MVVHINAPLIYHNKGLKAKEVSSITSDQWWSKGLFLSSLSLPCFLGHKESFPIIVGIFSSWESFLRGLETGLFSPLSLFPSKYLFNQGCVNKPIEGSNVYLLCYWCRLLLLTTTSKTAHKISPPLKLRRKGFFFRHPSLCCSESILSSLEVEKRGGGSSTSSGRGHVMVWYLPIYLLYLSDVGQRCGGGKLRVVRRWLWLCASQGYVYPHLVMVGPSFHNPASHLSLFPAFWATKKVFQSLWAFFPVGSLF